MQIENICTFNCFPSEIPDNSLHVNGEHIYIIKPSLENQIILPSQKLLKKVCAKIQLKL